MLSIDNLIYGGGYAKGAATITAGQPRYDGNIDVKDSAFPRRMREQINWLLVNGTDIPAIVESSVDKQIGVTINVQVGSPSSRFNTQAEELIEYFCGYEFTNGTERAVGELTGIHHFDSSARIMARFTKLNGGFLIRHHFDPKWKFPYRYELVGVDMIDVGKTQRLFVPEGVEESTINGLVRNKYGEITHIWIYSDISKTKSTKVPYQDLTYVAQTWISIDQITAVSKLTSILSMLDASSQYGMAELESAIEEAKAGHYVESAIYSELMKIVGEEIARATSGKTGNTRITEARDMVTPILKAMSDLGLKARGLTPLPLGDKPVFNTTRRNGIYKDMTDNADMKIAASQGMSDVGAFAKVAKASFSAIKYDIERDQRSADVDFNDLTNRAFFAIFSRVVQTGVQIGWITDRVAFWKEPHKYLKFRYLRQNKIDTEPSKNALANKTNIALGVKTPAEIVESTSGVKYETFLDNKLQDDKLRIDKEIQLALYRRQAYEKAGIMPVEEPQLGATNG